MRKKEIYDKLSSLWDYTLDNINTPVHRVVELGTLSKRQAKKLFKLVNFDFSEYVFMVDNYAIIHILKKHGDPIKEALQGQVAINKQNFVKVYDTLLRSEKCEITLNKKGLKSGKFEKEMDNNYVAVAEIIPVTKKRKKNKVLLTTMYIKKNTNKKRG